MLHVFFDATNNLITEITELIIIGKAWLSMCGFGVALKIMTGSFTQKILQKQDATLFTV